MTTADRCDLCGNDIDLYICWRCGCTMCWRHRDYGGEDWCDWCHYIAMGTTGQQAWFAENFYVN